MTALDPLSPLGSVINTDLKNHYARAKDIVQANSDSIRRIADALLEHREMDGATLSKLLVASHGSDVQRAITAVE